MTQKKKRVLLVEDSDEVRKLVALSLGHHYEVVHASNAAQAMSLATAEPPDLVILDVMLPGGANGFDLLALLREHPVIGSAKVIMMTALDGAAERETACRLRVDDYFVKPFSPLRLVDRARSLVP